MNKLALSVLTGVFLINAAAFGATKECSYSPLQQVIRTARNEGDIMHLIQNNVNLDIYPKCGGGVYQLAVLRGNPGIIKTLIENSGLKLDVNVSNGDYPIAGAPKEIPLAFFAAYYAPSIEIMRLFKASGMNLLGLDSHGETILWYLNQNPVLMNTEIVDEIKEMLIMNSTAAGTGNKKVKPDGGQKTPADDKKAADNDKKLAERKKAPDDNKKTNNNPSKEQALLNNLTKSDLVEEEPFQPVADLSNQASF